jgi:hypothetical protein
VPDAVAAEGTTEKPVVAYRQWGRAGKTGRATSHITVPPPPARGRTACAVDWNNFGVCRSINSISQSRPSRFPRQPGHFSTWGKRYARMALLTVGSGGVPVGSYTAEFVGFENQPENKEKGYGAGLRWKFVIESGPQAGQVASRITQPLPTTKNSCGKILAGLLGRALRDGEQVDPDAFVGKRYMIVVAAGQNGGTRVEAIVPVGA